MKNISKRGLLKPLSRVTAAVCAAVPVGNIIIDKSISTCATGMVDRKLMLWLGDAYLTADTEGREQMLRHEAHHIFCNHMARRQKREAVLWNKVCDAAIHHRTNVDVAQLDALVGKVVTFDRLKIAPCPPEIAYELLQQKQEEEPDRPEPQSGEQGNGKPHKQDAGQSPPPPKQEEEEEPQGCGCGTQKNAPEHVDPVDWVVVSSQVNAAAREEAEETGVHPFDTDFQGWSAGAESSSTRVQPITRLPATPKWVSELIGHMLKSRGRDIRGRTWRREHRTGHPLLPGRGGAKAWHGIFMVDASGSINTAALELMLAAVCETPELRHARVYLFDTRVSEEFLASDRAAILHATGNHRGGTRIHGAAKAVGEDYPRIWFTDAYSHDGLPPDRDEDLWVVVRGTRDEDIKIVDYPQEGH